jgi:acyl-homoserine-lactone acylase
VLAAAPLAAQDPAAAPVEPDALPMRVEIVRTEFGVPHILADDLAAMGYGLAWVMMEDYREDVPEALLRANGRWALAGGGADAVTGDFAGRLDHAFAGETYHLLPKDVRDVYAGYAAGLNDFIRTYPDSLPSWARPEFTPQDIAARDISVWDQGAVTDFERLRRREPPVEPDPEDGSNAWALAPERSRSGNALLLRNPHLSWTAGYYEAHVRVPGVIDFYGDFRLGGPFTTIGGFNRRLGWATTNNGPVLEQFYALLRAPEDPDAYLFDGGRVAIERERVTAEFVRSDGSIGRGSREFAFTPLGPVVYEVADTIYVVKAHGLSQYRVGEQWLRMMQAQDFEAWTEAMKIRAKVSSNLTYADADGVIHLVWNAAIPALPHPVSDYPVLATSTDEVWTELVPYDELPQLTNPPGGYVQNANDPPYYTNLRAVLPREDFPANFPDPELRFRSQNSLELIDSDDRYSLEEFVELKHAMGMTIADRMKDGLIRALGDSLSAAPISADLYNAIHTLKEWDNTASRDSRGSALFELWVDAYFDAVPDSMRYSVPWSEDEPMTTPRGIGDEAAAVAAFGTALRAANDRWGRWDVTWGEVHRIRPDSSDVDVPVGGCSSALGCFRVVGFVDDEDGKYRGYRGDGWVVAVEFAETPVARSVLLYGNSNRPRSERYYDQAELFAENRMKPVAFTLDDIERGAVARYRPGGDPSR